MVGSGKWNHVPITYPSFFKRSIQPLLTGQQRWSSDCLCIASRWPTHLPRFNLCLFTHPAPVPCTVCTHQSTVSPSSFLQEMPAAHRGTQDRSRSTAGRHQADPAGILGSRLRRASPELSERRSGAALALSSAHGGGAHPARPTGQGQRLLGAAGNCSRFLQATKSQSASYAFDRKKYFDYLEYA